MLASGATDLAGLWSGGQPTTPAIPAMTAELMLGAGSDADFMNMFESALAMAPSAACLQRKPPQTRTARCSQQPEEDLLGVPTAGTVGRLVAGLGPLAEGGLRAGRLDAILRTKSAKEKRLRVRPLLPELLPGQWVTAHPAPLSSCATPGLNAQEGPQLPFPLLPHLSYLVPLAAGGRRLGRGAEGGVDDGGRAGGGDGNDLPGAGVGGGGPSALGCRGWRR